MKRLHLRQLFVACSTVVLASAVAFACGSEESPPPCIGAACDDAGREGSVPAEGGVDARSDRDAGLDAGDAGDAAEESSACPGPAGTLDPTFGDGGIVVLGFAGETARADAVVMQPDGKIVVGGVRTPAGDHFAIVRLLPNGVLDTAFGNAGVVQTQVGNTSHALRAIARQPDGKLVIAGYTRFVGQEFDFALVRYLPDGTLDTTFGSAGVVLTDFAGGNDQANALALMADGRIVAAGFTLSSDLTVGDMAFARYNADGSLDATFGAGGRALVDIRGTPDQARDIAILPGGGIVAAGTSRDPNVSRTDIAVIRLDADGSLDPTFGTLGKIILGFGGVGSDAANGAALDGMGRLLLGGLGGGNDFAAARLSGSGAIDATFGGGLVRTDLSARNDTGNAIAVQADGKMILVGSSLSGAPSDARVGIVRYLPDGGLDPTFGSSGKVLTALPAGLSGAAIANGLALDTCTFLVVGGWFDSAAGESRMGFARYRR